MDKLKINGRIYVSLILRGKDLIPQQVMDSIKILPTRSFKRGDIRRGSKKWPHGYWELDSSKAVQSSNLSVHLEWLVGQLELNKSGISDLINQEKIDAEISCFWILATDHEEFILSSELINRIASLGLNINFDIYCPD